MEAPFLYVENGDPVSLSHAEGKIVLINGGANAENYEKLEKAGAVGFLILTGTPLDKDEDRLPDYRTLRGVKNPKLPCAVIHYLDAMELVERGASRARLVLQQKKIRRTSKNIILRIPGTEQPEKILTLTAHYDSVPQGPGAYDNMAGAAIIMELAHYFAENRRSGSVTRRRSSRSYRGRYACRNHRGSASSPGCPSMRRCWNRCSRYC